MKEKPGQEFSSDRELRKIDIEHQLTDLFNRKLEAEGERNTLEAAIEGLQKKLESREDLLREIGVEEQKLKQELEDLA